MKLQFENWLEKQTMKNDERELFREAILCFKANAYRGSLLLSVLAFQKTLKNRVLEADKPDNIQYDINWQKIQSNLLKQEKWDEEVNKLIRTTDDQKRVFSISDDLRTQAAYWKDRRNDCAHAKDNIIHSAHIEAFWSFLQSNLELFEVGGSVQALLNEIKTYLDPTYTPSSQKPGYIIDRIEKIIDEDNVYWFIDEIFDNYFDKEVANFLFDLEHDRELKFIVELLNVENEIFEKQLHRRLKKEEKILFHLLNIDETILNIYSDDPQFLRFIWKSERLMNPLNILLALLRNKLLPEKEKSECFYMFIFNYEINIANIESRELDKLLLQNEGFFQSFEEVVFNKGIESLINRFDWANNKKNIDSVISFLQINGLNQAIVKNINNIFFIPPFPFKMQENLKALFEDNEKLRSDYLEFAKKLETEVTSNLLNI